LQNNYIAQHRYHIEIVTITNVASPGTDTWAATTATDSVIYPCRYNYVQKHLFEAGGTSSADGTSMSSSNADVAHVQSTVDSLQIEKAFRDPIITGAHGTDGAGTGGITDAVFDTYITSEPEGDLQACAESLYDFRGSFNGQSRTGASNGNANKGTAIDYANTTWAALHTELSTFGTNCTKRVVEIDARIGVPTRAGTRSTARGTPPAIYVDTVPSSNTTNGYVPYGRTLYNECNYILGSDLNLLGNLIKDVQSLGDLIDIVKKTRNRYELYNGRDKEYTDV
jgi:hypothetical protein